jgi:hypothetical protein
MNGGRWVQLPMSPPTPEPPATLVDPIELDILEALAAGGKMRREELIAALRKAGRAHGDTAVLLALARMARRGEVVREAMRGRGARYALAPAPPEVVAAENGR